MIRRRSVASPASRGFVTRYWPVVAARVTVQAATLTPGQSVTKLTSDRAKVHLELAALDWRLRLMPLHVMTPRSPESGKELRF
jgi:hypothetical protein